MKFSFLVAATAASFLNEGVLSFSVTFPSKSFTSRPAHDSVLHSSNDYMSYLSLPSTSYTPSYPITNKISPSTSSSIELAAPAPAGIVQDLESAPAEDDEMIRFIHAPLSHFDIPLLTPKGPRTGADVGSPHDSTRKLVQVGQLRAGAWWCAAGGWPSPNLRTTTEIFYVLKGRGCVTDLEGTKMFFGPGDLVILPMGWSGRWDVLEDIHKVWVVTEHPDVDYSIKAVVKNYAELAPHFLTSHGVREDAYYGTSPTTSSTNFYHNGYVSAGAWSCSPGSFPVHDLKHTEAFHLLEGICFVTNMDGSAQKCVAGDTVVLPKGWSGSWDIIETVKKVCTICAL